MDAVSSRISGLEGSFHRVEPGGSMAENGGQGIERARAVCGTKGLADRLNPLLRARTDGIRRWPRSDCAGSEVDPNGVSPQRNSPVAHCLMISGLADARRRGEPAKITAERR